MLRQSSIKFSLSNLWIHLSLKRKKQFKFLLFLICLSSIFEAFSIGAVIPFLAALTSPDWISKSKFGGSLVDLFQINGIRELQFFLTSIFAVSVIASACIRTFLLWFTINFSFQTGADFSQRIYNNVLYRPYQEHLTQNSSEIIGIISIKVNEVIHYILIPLINVISSIIISTVIFITLLIVLPKSVIISIGFLIAIYIFILKKSKKILNENSNISSQRSVSSFKILQESLGGIRDVLINNLQKYFFKIFEENDRLLRKSQSNTQFISQCPRHSIEGLGMLIIIILAYYLSGRSDYEATIPMLAALAIGAQRLLPALNQLYLSISTIEGSQGSLKSVLKELEDNYAKESLKNYECASVRSFNAVLEPPFFRRKFELINVGFSYANSQINALNNINMCIDKGDRVGIIGETGGGKSTLVDIVMGLLSPQKGGLHVDDALIDSKEMSMWQSTISHVPQTIFLSDDTIAENIAFGVDLRDIDMQRVVDCAKRAEISGWIDELPLKYKTLVGERGVFLSGGQRQRIGIARALYKNADVLILDEATSALDNEIEAKVIASLSSLDQNLTVIMIAHRLSTLEVCNKVYRIENKTLVQVR